MKEQDDVDRLILKAADVMEKQGHVKCSLGASDGPVCVVGSLMVASGMKFDKANGWLTYGGRSQIVKDAESRLESVLGQDICRFNNRDNHDKNHVVSSMRAVANGDPFPQIQKAA